MEGDKDQSSYTSLSVCSRPQIKGGAQELLQELHLQ